MSFGHHRVISTMPGAPATTCGTLIILFKLGKNMIRFKCFCYRRKFLVSLYKQQKKWLIFVRLYVTTTSEDMCLASPSFIPSLLSSLSSF